MKPSIALGVHREEIRALVGKYRTSTPRIFGSVARGDDGEESDIDILVDTLPGATLFDLGGLQYDLQELLGAKVDVATSEGMRPRIRTRVMAEAVPL